MSGQSASRSKAGAAVRAEPRAAARILGRLAPGQRATEADKEDVPPNDEIWRTEFRIVGYRDGWFLIEKAMHPYDDPDRRGVLGRRSTGGVRTYAGRGWLAREDVSGKYVFYRRSLSNGALFAEPDPGERRLPARNALGDPIQGGNSPRRVLACSGEWVQVESHDGVVGWWKGLCGEPIGDCGRD
jgi:hypothetical protein